MKILLFTIYVGLLTLAGNQAKAEECWREMTSEEINQNWRQADAKGFAKASGDFSGRGFQESAKFVASCDSKLFSLVVTIHQDSSTKEFRLVTLPYAQLPAYGITTIASGKYDVLCKAGTESCAKGVKSVALLHQSLKLFKDEGVSSIFLWDANLMKFKQAWLDD